MYLCIALDVSKPYKCLREKVSDLSIDLGLNNPCLLLPFHVSLKISFMVDINNKISVIEKVISILHEIKEIELEPTAIEQNGSIVWIRYKENNYLESLHDYLDKYLYDNFNINQSYFDNNFIFHTTLLQTKDEISASNFLNYINNYNLPIKFKVTEASLFVSETGDIGSYKVYTNIKLK